MEENEKTSIQLLPEEKFEEYSLGKKLTTWVISVGRIVIIVTELIAFSVFVGRIKFDRQLTDLTDALENQLVILENVEGFERDFRDLQQRLQTIKELRQNRVPTGEIISFFISLLPQDVSLIELSLQPKETRLRAKTSSATGFAQTIYRLKNSPKIESTALTSGRFSSKDGMYHFSLAIKLAPLEVGPL